MPLGTINHMALSVVDMARSAAFYDVVLGWMGYSRMPVDEDVVIIWLKPGSGAITISPSEPAAGNRPHNRYAPGFHHLAFDADNRDQVDRFHRMLIDHGFTVLDPPAAYDYTPGYYAVFFADPDGMKLELVHMPLDESGAPPGA